MKIIVRPLLLISILTISLLGYFLGCKSKTTAETKKKVTVELIDSNLFYKKTDTGTLAFHIDRSGIATDTIKVKYIKVDSLAVFQGDIILTKIHPQLGFIKALRPQAFMTTQPIWPNSTVPYIFDNNVLKKSQAVILAAMQLWENATNVKFVPRTKEKDYVHFFAYTGYGSFIGRLGGDQPIYIMQYPDTGNVVHELGHCLGLWHEHCRPDRNQFITINENNVKDGYLCQFIQPVSDVTTLGSSYDLNSIMHYPRNAFTKNGLNTITVLNDNGHYNVGNRDSLSKGDINGVIALYKSNPNFGDPKTVKLTQLTCSE
jgi:hypothetical protein